MKKVIVFVVVLAVVFFTACFAFAFEVKLNMGHGPWHFYGTYLLGMQQGFFAKRGIKVKLVYSNGSAEAIEAVASGRDDFAQVPSAPVIVAKAKGFPVVVAASISNEGYSGAVFFRSNMGITVPKDLEGKKVAYSSVSTHWPPFVAFLKKNGVDIDNIDLISVPFGSETSFFLNRNVVAYVGQLSTEEAVLNDEHKLGKGKWGYFLFRDYGVKVPTPAIVTNKRLWERNPRIAKGFTEAALESWEYAMKNPEAAIEALMAAYPDAGLNPKLELSRSKVTYDFTKLSPGGCSDKEAWNETIEMLWQAGLFEKSFDASELIVGRFCQ